MSLDLLYCVVSVPVRHHQHASPAQTTPINVGDFLEVATDMRRRLATSYPASNFLSQRLCKLLPLDTYHLVPLYTIFGSTKMVRDVSERQ
jgi:hypothetical protein